MIGNLDSLHEVLLLGVAKAERIAVDDTTAIEAVIPEVDKLTKSAEDSLDAAKLVRNKLKSFLAGL